MARLCILFFFTCSLQLTAQMVDVPVWVVKDSSHYNTRFLDSTQYLNGLKHGRSLLYKRDKLYREQNWEFGKLNGKHIEYVDGLPREVAMYRVGIPIDTSFEYSSQPVYHLSSKIIYYSDGHRKLKSDYNKSGALLTRTYFNPVSGIDSTFHYYPNGTISWESRDIDKIVDPSGQSGGWHSIRHYYPSGKLHSAGNEKSHSKEGEWISFDSSGTLLSRVYYTNNEPHGWFTSYYEDSTLQLRTFCYKSYTDTITVYDRNGIEVSHSDPLYDSIIWEQHIRYTKVHFRNPNRFDPRNLYNRDDSVFVTIIPHGGLPITKQPSYPGGLDSLNAFFARNINYPQPEKAVLAEGIVYIEFVVQTDGTITDVFGHGGPYDNWGLEKEALRVFRLMPKWKPAQYNGNNVKCEFEIAVNFYII